MGHRGCRWIVVLAFLFVAAAVLADQGAPVYQAIVTKPVVGGSCVGERVQIEFDTGRIWCCGATAAGQWGLCGVAKEAASLNLAVDPADCTGNNFARGIGTTGAAACAQPSFANLTGAATSAQMYDDATAGKVFVSGGAGDPGYMPFLTIDTSKVMASKPLEMAAIAAATSTNAFYGSQQIQFDGSYWNGTTAVASQGTIEYVPTPGSPMLGTFFFKVDGSQVAKIDTNGGGLITAGEFSGNGRSLQGVVKENNAAATLGACDAGARGKVQVKTGSGVPDQVYLCLQNSDATFSWAMFGMAVK